MKPLFIILLFLLQITKVYSNDGVYTISGGQLIPIYETDIDVQKELLQIINLLNGYIEVNVYYEFYNHSSDKDVLVGFEAQGPFGDINKETKNNRHPYLHNFSVLLNDNFLPYKVASINRATKLQEINYLADQETDSTSYYEEGYLMVYYFNAKFLAGKNIVKHNYIIKSSSSIALPFNFEYILTGATRWRNKQIDDFELIIDMGSPLEFGISRNFFNNGSDWIINGRGKYKMNRQDSISFSYPLDEVIFTMQQGYIVFKQKNFAPKKELFIYTIRTYISEDFFNASIHTLPFNIDLMNKKPQPKDIFSKKILRNLPFARRGMIFKDPLLNAYFSEKCDWYLPYAHYSAELALLTEMEKVWVKSFAD